MTPNTTISYRVTGTHLTNPTVIIYLSGYCNTSDLRGTLITEGYSVTVHRITTTTEDVTNAR